MMDDMRLTGIRVLITRASQQAQPLVDLITKLGGNAIYFPVIEIRTIDKKLGTNLSPLNADIIIFVSSNAANYFLRWSSHKLPTAVCVIAPGKETAATLRRLGVSNVLHPSKFAGSEGILMLPELKKVLGKQIIIVRGQGGRELLADTLETRGANIRYIEIYERALPPIPTDEQYKQALSTDTIVCTSVTGVTNLTLLLSKNIEAMLVKPLVVFSERIKEHALLLGFKKVIVSIDMNNQAIIQCLAEITKCNSG